ncbi:hypothetical protein C9374_006825 [Naegleria lovaniensis]|uniref:F-box domain-containing protein n=1 Tax=Naegleria lovaniensis TaxID=51637 RepID=A0AA88KS39_NAELO|nr:uncharacterized protein C9374_006825 [Naegleria lovaniensis]KAG2393294.1 hypothetical protein C9374_006825 [Naegleria lovaniensis]
MALFSCLKCNDDTAHQEEGPILEQNSFSKSQQNSSSDTKRHVLIVCQLPEESILLISSYLELQSLSRFASCHSQLLRLLFNITPQKLLKPKQTKLLEILNPNATSHFDFSVCQLLIWKPLLIYYFPRFEQSLNVKNWMLALKRRIQHLQLYSPHLLPIKQQSISSSWISSSQHGSTIFKIQIDTIATNEFIENCEWIFKCPLRFSELQEIETDPSQKYCTVCEKTVYLVKSNEEFTRYAMQGHCVAFTSRKRDALCEVVMGQPLVVTKPSSSSLCKTQ